MASFLRYNADARHIVVQDGLLAPIVPFDGDPGPVLFGNSAKVVVVVAPADAGADVEQSGLGAGHSFCRFVAILLGSTTLDDRFHKTAHMHCSLSSRNSGCFESNDMIRTLETPD